MTRTQPNRMYGVAATSDGHVYPPVGPGKSNKPTIFDRLQAAGISWRVYVPDDTPPPLVSGSDLVYFTTGETIRRTSHSSRTLQRMLTMGIWPRFLSFQKVREQMNIPRSRRMPEATWILAPNLSETTTSFRSSRAQIGRILCSFWRGTRTAASMTTFHHRRLCLRITSFPLI